jgi:hypothetical protein
LFSGGSTGSASIGSSQAMFFERIACGFVFGRAATLCLSTILLESQSSRHLLLLAGCMFCDLRSALRIFSHDNAQPSSSSFSASFLRFDGGPTWSFVLAFDKGSASPQLLFRKHYRVEYMQYRTCAVQASTLLEDHQCSLPSRPYTGGSACKTHSRGN